MNTSAVKHMFKELKVLTLKQVSRESACSIRTVQRQFTKLPVLRSYNKNSRYYTLSGIPDFNSEGIWNFRGILFSKYGNLKTAVQSLIFSSEQGLSGKQIGEIVQLSPRSFMHHFRKLEGVFREKHDGVYVYFNNGPTKYAEQSSNRDLLVDVENIGDAKAVKILVEYIRHPEMNTSALSDHMQQKRQCRVSASQVESFLAFHGLFKKKRDPMQ